MAASQRSQRKAAKPDATLDWGQVRAFRVRSHRLDRPVPRDAMLDAVGGICGLHAQIMSSAELGLFNRVQELASGDLSEALWVKRSLVKTWAMRGTLHILPARE